MARPGLLSHRKFRALCRSVGDRAKALGSLQLIWFASWEAADPVIGTADDVEHVASWRGAPGELAKALFDAGFLDLAGDFHSSTGEAVYVVHDFEDHLPEYVRKRLIREKARRDEDLSGQVSGQTSGQTAAASPDERPPSGQGRTEQDRAEQGRSVGAPRGASKSSKRTPAEDPPDDVRRRHDATVRTALVADVPRGTEPGGPDGGGHPQRAFDRDSLRQFIREAKTLAASETRSTPPGRSDTDSIRRAIPRGEAFA